MKLRLKIHPAGAALAALGLLLLPSAGMLAAAAAMALHEGGHVLAMALCYGLVGFADDFVKV